MDYSRRVRLFRNGRNQAVRIPREFELPGSDVVMSRAGDAIVIRPTRSRLLLEVLKDLRPLDEDFPAIDELPTDVGQF